MTAVCQKTARSPSNRYAKELNEENSFEPKIEFLCNTEIVLFPNFLSWEGQKVDSFCLRTTLWLCWWQSLGIERQEHFLGAVGSFHTHERQSLSCAWWGEGMETTPRSAATLRTPTPNPKVLHLKYWKFQLNQSKQNEHTNRQTGLLGKDFLANSERGWLTALYLASEI